MPLIDDHAAIARRMRELEVEGFAEQLPELAANVTVDANANITVIVHPPKSMTAAVLRELIDRMRARLRAEQERRKQLLEG